MTQIGPILADAKQGLCGFDPELGGVNICGRRATLHILMREGETESSAGYACEKHARAALALSVAIDAHLVDPPCLSMVPTWRTGEPSRCEEPFTAAELEQLAAAPVYA